MQCAHPITLKMGEIVPCGKCPQCLANQRQEWVFRLRQEFKRCEFGLFVTLTYDDDHLPPDGVSKRDVQLFLKRLRKKYESSELRYYIVSEYGDHTHRAHYHGLLFFQNKHERIAVYDDIEKSWQNGFCSFGEIEEGSIVYCTKYCLKKCIVPKGQNPVFRLLSKMQGGLGGQYIEDMQEYHLSDMQLHTAYDHGLKSRMPRFYRDKFLLSKFGSKNNPLYLRYQWSKRMDADSDFYEDNIENFKAFIRGKHFESFDASVKAYTDYLNERTERKSELILKHTKKQVM